MTKAVCKFAITHKTNIRPLKRHMTGYFRGMYKNYTRRNYRYIIFEGDVSQIDKPTLSKRSNGLVYLSEKFKGNPLCAQIAMKDSECVRSELAAEASRIL